MTVSVLWFFLKVPWVVCSVIVVFPDHTIFFGPSMRPNRGLGNRGERHLFHGNRGQKAKF